MSEEAMDLYKKYVSVQLTENDQMQGLCKGQLNCIETCACATCSGQQT